MRIKEIRKARGMTGAELAKAIHTTPVTISRYETGKRMPSIEKVVEMAKVLGVTIEELIGKKAG